MSKHLLCVATLPHLDGYVKDDAKTSWVFTAADSVAVDDVASLVADVFTHVQTNGQKVGNYISSSRTRVSGGCRVDVFDISGHLDGSPHGSPVDTHPFTLPAAATGLGSNLPAEVAACISVRAAGATAVGESGPPGPIPTDPRAIAEGAPATHTGRPRPRSRYRGRMYMGPLTTGAMDGNTTDQRVKLDGVFQATLGLAGRNLITTSATISAPWGVWSRRDGVVRPIDTVTVDDAFDTQRRRGEARVGRGSY